MRRNEDSREKSSDPLCKQAVEEKRIGKVERAQVSVKLAFGIQIEREIFFGGRRVEPKLAIKSNRISLWRRIKCGKRVTYLGTNSFTPAALLESAKTDCSLSPPPARAEITTSTPSNALFKEDGSW